MWWWLTDDMTSSEVGDPTYGLHIARRQRSIGAFFPTRDATTQHLKHATPSMAEREDATPRSELPHLFFLSEVEIDIGAITTRP
jgi:hypothetical protein